MKLFASLVLLSLLGDSAQMTPSPLFNCNDNMDVVLVADASQSVAPNFLTIQAAVNAFVTEISTNNPNIRVGVVFYNDNVVEQQLTTDRVTLETFVNTQSGGSGSTRTDQGILRAKEMLDRRVQSNPANIVVLTDAISQQPQLTRQAAESARAAGYTLFAIGVNVDATYERELFDITYDQGRLFTLDGLDQVSETVVELGKSLCAYTVCSGCLVDAGSRRAAHPNRCDKFYMCERRENQQMKAYEKTCGVGTLWHRRFQTCVPSLIALNDAEAGCGYCAGTKRTFAIGDHCQIFYECSSNSDGNALLNVNCCPTGQSYDDFSGTCQSLPTTCSARRYHDSVSCRSYYFCGGVSSVEWTRDCCAGTGLGQRYNATSQTCEDDSLENDRCIGACYEATQRPCGNLFAHPTNKCKFRVIVASSVQDMDCAGGSSFNESACQCMHDSDCPRTPVESTCEPDVVIPVTATQNKIWGFSESSRNRRWIDAHRVGFDTEAVVLSGIGFLTIPYYSNNDQAFAQNTVSFRLSVMDDFVDSSPINREMVVLSNMPCPATYSEAGATPSVYIYLNPSTGTATFGVRTTDGEASVVINYTPGVQGTWKELTLRYTQNPGNLEAHMTVYTLDNLNQRQILQEVPGSPEAISGRILTSACGMIIGHGLDPATSFQGRVDNVLFYDDCKTTVPAVNAANPPGLF